MSELLGNIKLGVESEKLDAKFSLDIYPEDRLEIWKSAHDLLNMFDAGKKTVMGLGYVQSGKTTSITALCAAAADRGFTLIVAILGSTILLRDQNRSRVEDKLGLDEHSYRWVSIPEFNLKSTSKDISNWLEKDRIVFVPVIKNAKVINKVAEIFSSCNFHDRNILVIDDEADQASLNTKVEQFDESATYTAIKNLRAKLPTHLFVQYTATPYAPLLLPDGDPLMPEDVQFLMPGRGYTGGREFFIDHSQEVLRQIPSSDEQNAKTMLSALPISLEKAICNYIVGATHLFFQDKSNAPISMLIHSTFKNDLQAKYHFLLEKYLAKMKTNDNLEESELGQLIQQERLYLYNLGVLQMSDDEFWEKVKYIIKEITLWLVNSASEVKKIKWNLAPFHILIGGNKLDRGFTVEGLTVTYMNRPVSDQIDTLEQRARAFGYRTNLLPYCQFFATARTIRMLRGIVHTEDDLRVKLRDSLDEGKTVSQWAKEMGLFLPGGAKPTRSSVIPSLKNFNPDGEWFSLRKPFTDDSSKAENLEVLNNIGIFDSPKVDYGRLYFKTLTLKLNQMAEILEQWKINNASPGWKNEDIIEFVSRLPDQDNEAYIILLDDQGSVRTRKWADDIGFINLFQGRDLNASPGKPFYKGDRELGFENYGKEKVILQIHHVTRRDMNDKDLYTLAIHLGDGRIVKK
jgi:hypothetical protein